MIACLRIIKLCQNTETYINSVRAIISECSGLEIVQIECLPYWKEQKITEIVIDILSPKETSIEIWGDMFMKVAGSYSVQMDDEFVELSCVVPLDTLKLRSDVVFATMHIPISFLCKND